MADGYIYILTNKSFREDWVKIGKTSRPVNTRSKELDNTAVPLPFDVYATLKTKDYDKAEKFIHKMIDSISPDKRIRKGREFFNVHPQKALEVFKAVQEILGGVIKLGDENSSHKYESAGKERWDNITQLCKLVARRGGNEGAFGGILQYFSTGKTHKPCKESSKWRKPLESIGVEFDDKGFVSDWSKVKHEL